jgi:hypothetical protein
VSEPREKYEPWSALGELAAHWAAWCAGALGVFLMIAAALLLPLLAARTMVAPACLLIFLFGGWGIALIACGSQIHGRRRGAAIAVLVMSLLAALLGMAFIGWLAYRWSFVFQLGEAMLPLALIGLIIVCGLLTVWKCIQTLGHWPRRVGAAFEVEALGPPADGGGAA